MIGGAALLVNVKPILDDLLGLAVLREQVNDNVLVVKIASNVEWSASAFILHHKELEELLL
jgi:hypothetical protein